MKHIEKFLLKTTKAFILRICELCCWYWILPVMYNDLKFYFILPNVTDLQLLIGYFALTVLNTSINISNSYQVERNFTFLLKEVDFIEEPFFEKTVRTLITPLFVIISFKINLFIINLFFN